jgi:hypothetical protein
LVVHLNQTLESLDQTSRPFGEFTYYLRRNPAALIRGGYVGGSCAGNIACVPVILIHEFEVENYR